MLRPVETILWKGEGELKKNDGRGKFNYENIVRTFVNATMYLQYNNFLKSTGWGKIEEDEWKQSFGFLNFQKKKKVENTVF
jgi:hypothetical protein